MATETPIELGYPTEETLTLRLTLGACRLRIRGSAAEGWVTGTYRDPSGDAPPRVRTEGGTVTISQGRSLAAAVGLFKGSPTCELALGAERPFRLILETGASEVELDLGGVPLTGVDLKAGAGKLELRVPTPNPAEAEAVTLRMGAGALETSGLGNLAAAQLRADTGAASVALDLRGELRRPLDARVNAGMSGVRITLPADRPARIHADTTLGTTDLGDGFMTREGALFTAADGDPVVTLHASVSVGNLQLRTG